MSSQGYTVNPQSSLFKDALGREINVGDQLVWAHTWGRSSARLARGVVVGFTRQRIKFMDLKTLTDERLSSRTPNNIQGGPTVLIVNEQTWEEVEQAKNEGLIL